MKMKEILDIVSGKEIYVNDSHLRDADESELLITGLANMQIFHTANTLDLAAILIVRGKTIDEHMIQGAKMSDVSVFVTDYTMYETCGRLYEKGLGK